jgi:hypothetical protein
METTRKTHKRQLQPHKPGFSSEAYLFMDGGVAPPGHKGYGPDRGLIDYVCPVAVYVCVYVCMYAG